MRLTAQFVHDQSSQLVLQCIEDAGYRGYFVGGCVRNAILGEPVHDIDIASSATPDEATTLFVSKGLKVVPTGVEHGTITVVAGGVAHEVTSFRKDVQTDGRRAVVAFSDNISDDARRRDFTMNALYADRNGQVIDPLGGLCDLQSRRVRFIENAEQRIKEDYLRSLRFFRFHAWYGDPEAGLDADALSAIAQNLTGLDGLSAERVGAEMLKLLAAPDPAPAVASMASVGVLAHILPGADPRFLAPLIHAEAGTHPDPVRRLAAIGGVDGATRLRLTRVQSRQLDRLVEASTADMGPAEMGYRFGEPTAIDSMLLRSAMFGVPFDQADIERIQFGALQKLPVGSGDLMPEYEGKELGKRLKEIEKIWIESGFKLTRGDLLRH
jgi:poly(A) polymerase